jgi:hypothetical protein
VSPSGCASSSECRNDSSCCVTGSWISGECNSAGSCPLGQRRRTRSVSPSGCATASECVVDATCNCSCNWTDQDCGPAGGCALNRMHQTGVCNFPDCTTTQCVVHPNCVSSCTVDFSPSPLNVGIDKSRILTAIPNPLHATVSQVSFGITLNPAAISLDNPTTDTDDPYSVVVHGNALGDSQVRANVTLLPEGSCQNTTDVVVRPTAWMQTQGGDVYTGGSLSNEIPETADNRNFSLDLNDWPGVIIHQEGVELGEYGWASDDDPDNWVAESRYEGKPFGTFQFFKKKFALEMQAPNFNSGDAAPVQDGVYYAQGPVVLSGESWQNLGADRWIVLLVEGGDVTINDDIVVPLGSFLAIATDGDINFNGEVNRAQGMFVADGAINTGVNTQAKIESKDLFGRIMDKAENFLSKAFHFNILAAQFPSDPQPSGSSFEGQGVFVANEFILTRDFGDERNDETPAEIFIARPDFIMSSYNGPDQNLWWFFQQWQELAP